MPIDRLNWELDQLSHLVISDLLEQVVAETGGMTAIEAVLGVDAYAHDNGITILSARELDLADLEPSRVFRRLLSVRRSFNDDREQVFA